MITLKLSAARLVDEAVKQAYPSASLTVAELLDMIEYPPDDSMGDLALPCFKLAKALRMAPPKSPQHWQSCAKVTIFRVSKPWVAISTSK